METTLHASINGHSQSTQNTVVTVLELPLSPHSDWTYSVELEEGDYVKILIDPAAEALKSKTFYANADRINVEYDWKNQRLTPSSVMCAYRVYQRLMKLRHNFVMDLIQYQDYLNSIVTLTMCPLDKKCNFKQTSAC